MHFGPLVQDVVVTAPDRDDVGALVFPNLGACRALCAPALAAAQPAGVLSDPAVRARFAELLTTFAAAHPGNSTHVARALLLDLPPSFERGEVTDKGSLNQKVMMLNRAADVEELYREPRSARVITPHPPS
jgi:feruloyl-CoA synthase